MHEIRTASDYTDTDTLNGFQFSRRGAASFLTDLPVPAEMAAALFRPLRTRLLALRSGRIGKHSITPFPYYSRKCSHRRFFTAEVQRRGHVTPPVGQKGASNGVPWEADADVSLSNSLLRVMSENWLPDQARDCSARV